MIEDISKLTSDQKLSHKYPRYQPYKMHFVHLLDKRIRSCQQIIDGKHEDSIELTSFLETYLSPGHDQSFELRLQNREEISMVITYLLVLFT